MFYPSLTAEKNLWGKGFANIVGIDEVGRGSWAGPLVAAGVILPINFKIPSGFADSKQLSPTKRMSFASFVKSIALGYQVIEIPTSTINSIGIGRATQLAFRKIAKFVRPNPDFVLVDAFHIKNIPNIKQEAIKHGDRLSVTIAAASIIAKVYRDELMTKAAERFPKYGFEKHKGYGTKAHQDAIKKYGFCDIHRVGYNLGFLFS